MPLPPLPLPTIPEAPSRANPSTFEALNDAAVEFQFNTLPPWIEEQVTRTFVNSNETSQSAAAAQAARNDAIAAANAASQSAGATEWAPETVYSIGEVVWSPIDMQSYRRRTAGSGTLDPSLDPANWTQIGGTSLDDLHANALSF